MAEASSRQVIEVYTERLDLVFDGNAKDPQQGTVLQTREDQGKLVLKDARVAVRRGNLLLVIQKSPHGKGLFGVTLRATPYASDAQKTVLGIQNREARLPGREGYGEWLKLYKDAGGEI